MAKNKPKRTLGLVGKSQRATEESSKDKFAQTESLAKGARATESASTSVGRISPQLSCTIAPEDKALLNELSLHLSMKAGKILNTSNVIRALIRYGYQHKDKLEV